MSKKPAVIASTLLVISLAIASGQAIAEREPGKITTAALESQVQSALDELMERMIEETRNEELVTPRHPDYQRLSRSRTEAAESISRIVDRSKRKLREVADSPIQTPYDNPQRLSLSILKKMSLSEADMEMLVRNAGTKSPSPVAFGDNPLQEFPYAASLYLPSVEKAIYNRFKEVSPKEISDKEVELVADVLWRTYGHDQEHLAILMGRLERESAVDLPGYHRENLGRLMDTLNRSSKGR